MHMFLLLFPKATEGEGGKLYSNVGWEAWAKRQLSGSGFGTHEGRRCSKEIVDCFNVVIELFLNPLLFK